MHSRLAHVASFTFYYLCCWEAGGGLSWLGTARALNLFPLFTFFSYISFPHGNASQVLGKANTSQRGLLISHVPTFLQLALLCGYQRRSLAGFRPRLGLFTLIDTWCIKNSSHFLAKRRRFLECLEDGRVYEDHRKGFAGLLPRWDIKLYDGQELVFIQ